MSDSFGSILQPPLKSKTLSKVNLLIATDSIAELKKITQPLQTANTDFTYDYIAINELGDNLPQKQYSAFLYENSQLVDLSNFNFVIQQLQSWRNVHPHLPLIFITHPLGDEQAVKLVRSGISAYILKANLDRLPQILAKNILDLNSQKATARQQQALIQQQQEKIRQLEIEKQSWLDREQLRQEHIAHLSHELRSPISSMVGFAGMLKEQYYGKLNQKQMQYVSALLSVGEHMLDLVKNYLDIVKIDANKQTLDLERLAVSDICQASLFIVDEKAKQKGLELIFNLGDNIDFCTADSVRLKQVLVNLLSNAIKFTDEGSVTLDVQRQEDLLCFAVIDTGTGISSANMTKLFKPFPQISNHHENTGLGLALSQKIAQLHGGDITVTSELGEGSCFTLNIPQYQLNEQSNVN